MAKKAIGDVLKRGEEIFQTVSGKLLERPAVAKAFEAALVGKSKVDHGVAVALKRMNVQTRGEFRALKARVDHLELQISDLRALVESIKAASVTPPAGRPRARSAKASRKA